MATKKTTSTANAQNDNRMRTAGFLILLGILVLFIDVGLYIGMVGTPETGATSEESAAYYAEKETALATAGWVGVACDVLLIVGAVMFVGRALATRTPVPAALGWYVLAIGSLVFLAVDLATATAMHALAAGAAAAPAAWQAFEAIGDGGFNLAMLLSSLGLAVILWAEARATDAAVPAWASYTGAGFGLVSVVGSVLVMTGLEAMFVLSFGMLIGLVPLAWTALKLAWPTFGTGTASKTATPS